MKVKDGESMSAAQCQQACGGAISIMARSFASWQSGKDKRVGRDRMGWDGALASRPPPISDPGSGETQLRCFRPRGRSGGADDRETCTPTAKTARTAADTTAHTVVTVDPRQSTAGSNAMGGGRLLHGV